MLGASCDPPWKINERKRYLRRVTSTTEHALARTKFAEIVVTHPRYFGNPGELDQESERGLETGCHNDRCPALDIGIAATICCRDNLLN